MSSHPVENIGELLAGYPELPFLAKPFTTEKLHQVLTPLLGAAPKVRGQRAGDRLPYRDRTRQSS
jgi:hypothetical protein